MRTEDLYDSNGFVNTEKVLRHLDSLPHGEACATLGLMLFNAFADNSYLKPMELSVETIDLIVRLGVDAVRFESGEPA